jgi:hypothetical protein
MGILKHFAIKENKMFEFRAEAFNVFNHTEWAGFPYSLVLMTCTGGANNSAGDPSCLGPGGANLFEINSAHLVRVVQLGAKFIF